MMHASQKSQSLLQPALRVALILLLILPGCVPREISQRSEAGEPAQARGADLMRLPMTGMNRTQKMLYWQNRPDVMENVQNWRLGWARRQMGLKPSPEDPAYREHPKEKSPFRQ